MVTTAYLERKKGKRMSQYNPSEAAKEDDAVDAYFEGRDGGEETNPHQPGTSDYRFWNQGFKKRGTTK
tara:strand:+ start:341 stop:544 length:204 start_codon:yes stop_codon:yes gene_type:complete